MFELFFLSIFINIVFFIFFENFSSLFLLYDIPGEKRKIHKVKISNAAGFIFAINALFIIVYFLFHEQTINIYLFSLFFFIIGFLDDKNYLNPITKLLISALIVYFSIKINDDFILKNLTIEAINVDMSIGRYSLFFTTLCVLLLLNALNMFDGINLQSGLFLSTVFLIFIFLNIYKEFSFIMIISLIFFLYFNYKNKIFLGNSGVWFCSYFISHALISSFNKNVISTEFILMILIFPGLDMFRVFLQRIFNKKHPFYADKIHIHHLLLKFLNQSSTAILIFLSYSIPILIYLFTENFIISFALLILTYLFIYIYFGYLKKN